MSVEFLSGLHGTPASVNTSRKIVICSVTRRDLCCSLKLRSCRLRSLSFSSSDTANEDGSCLLLVPPFLLLEVMGAATEDLTGAGGAVMGIVNASLCVRGEGPNSVAGFFGGGGKRAAFGCGGTGCCGGKVAPPEEDCIVVCCFGALAADMDDVVHDDTDGSVETTPRELPPALYAEWTNSLSKSRSSEAVN